MEQLLCNYEEVYQFKRDNQEDLFQELSSLNNNYSLEESEINAELFCDEFNFKKDMEEECANASTSQPSSIKQGSDIQKDVGILDQTSLEF